MKSSLFLIFTIILSTGAKLRIEDRVNLISDIYDFYRQSSIIFVHFTNPKSMSEINVVFKIILKLSQKKIQTSTINSEKITLFKKYYDSGVEKLKESMFVIFLTSRRAVTRFEEFSQVLHLHKSVKLVLFEEIVEKPLKDLCLKPVGNPFKLKLNTLMLVKCYEENMLRQWYSVYENQTSLYNWANWNSKTRLILKDNDSLYTRRGDLHGKDLRIATVNSSRLSHWKSERLGGYYGDLIRILEKLLNFTSKYVKNENGFGRFDEINGNWSGAMGLVARKEVDLVVSEFIMTSERLKMSDFSTPLFLTRDVLYIKTQSMGQSINWTAHFEPFCKEAWSAIILFILTTSILISCIEKNDKQSINKLSRFSKNYFNIWGIYCQQGLAESPSELSVRLLYFSLLFFGFIISSIYSATLVSNFTIPTINLPFSSLEGFMKDGSYKLAILRDSGYSDIFKNSNDTILREMNKLIMKKKELPLTDQDGFNMVCQGKVAFYTTENTEEINNVEITCQLTKITTGRYSSVSLLLQKDSPYTAFINNQ